MSSKETRKRLRGYGTATLPRWCRRRSYAYNANLICPLDLKKGQYDSLLLVADRTCFRVNGDLVNHGNKCTTTKGQIALQAEGSEVEFRKLELTPIKMLTE